MIEEVERTLHRSFDRCSLYGITAANLPRSKHSSEDEGCSIAAWQRPPQAQGGLWVPSEDGRNFARIDGEDRVVVACHSDMREDRQHCAPIRMLAETKDEWCEWEPLRKK